MNLIPRVPPAWEPQVRGCAEIFGYCAILLGFVLGFAAAGGGVWLLWLQIQS